MKTKPSSTPCRTMPGATPRAFAMIELPVVREGFTLIELLVVIAIISLLVSILMPSLARAKAMAMRVICSSNLRSVHMGYLYYRLLYAAPVMCLLALGIILWLWMTRTRDRQESASPKEVESGTGGGALQPIPRPDPPKEREVVAPRPADPPRASGAIWIVI